jgi:hypothetical protein
VGVTIRVVGAGLGRTGTASLRLALAQLLGGPCYHMFEVRQRPLDADVWTAAFNGNPPDWREFLADWSGVVDWPAAAFWEEISQAFPDAPILLSTRDADSWWRSASNTIFLVVQPAFGSDVPSDPWYRMIRAMMASFTVDWQDEAKAKAAYLAHNDHVRATAPADRLVEWHPGDGWGPICAAVGLPEPAEPFPHVNTTEEFRAMRGLS